MAAENSGRESAETEPVRKFGGMDMLLCTGITAACSVLGFGGLFPREAMLPIRIAALILLAVNWLFSAYSNGKHGRYLFLLFLLIYWIAPTLTYIACDFSVSDDKWVLFIKGFCSLLTISPFAFAAEMTGLPEWFFGALMLIISAAVFKFSYSAFFIKDNKKWL